MTTETDALLILRSRKHPEVFAEIFDRHAPVLHRYFARRLGPDLADDLLAETFLAAFRKRGDYDTARTDARPWLYGIGANVISQRRREEARQLRLLSKMPADRAHHDHADRVVERAVAQASRAELASALANLSQRDREVLLLIAWEELTYDEVAEALSIPVGTVRSRLHRARRKVRAWFNGADPSGHEMQEPANMMRERRGVVEQWMR